MVWLPGPTLKKVAITEMRHAEAIVERVVALGGEPTTEPEAVVIGRTMGEMLENDREQERAAIQLYMLIISVAQNQHDDVTGSCFSGSCQTRRNTIVCSQHSSEESDRPVVAS